MILEFMVYGLALGVLAAVAAWLLERALAALQRARRMAWAGGIAAALLAPVFMALFEPAASVDSLRVTRYATAAPGPAAALVPTQFVAGMRTAEVAHLSLDAVVAMGWIFASVALISFYVCSAWRLSRRARQWNAAQVNGRLVDVAPDIGPAVFGWARPRVIFPRWLITAPEDVQSMALAHEREHLAARDPQLLSGATLLSALCPWNFPLLWMLRRLRFAMEVDCDSRVLRSGADANDYGLALLYVSERQERAPHAAIALIERSSELERRIHIMFASPRRFAALIAGVCLALAGSCIFAAAQLEAPGRPASLMLKPPPEMSKDGPGLKLAQRFEMLLRDRYPQLIRQEFTGTPVVVVLVNDDGSIARSAMTIADQPIDSIETSEEMFGILGLPKESVPYVGNMGVQVAKGSDKVVLMVYTEQSKPGEPFASSLFPDTRALDRKLFQQQFPQAAKQGVAAGQNPWVLLDREGRVLRSGIEKVESDWNEALERRYPGITTREGTVTSITDGAGEPLRDAADNELHLHSVWLAPDSPSPRD